MTELQAAESTHQSGFKRLGCLVYAIAFLLVLFMLVSVSFMGWYGGSKSSLESELQRIRSRNEPLWFADLAPKEVDPQEDGTPTYMAALGKLKPVTQGFNELLSAEPATPPGKYLEFESLLEQNRPALELLAEAVRKPYFR